MSCQSHAKPIGMVCSDFYIEIKSQIKLNHKIKLIKSNQSKSIKSIKSNQNQIKINQTIKTIKIKSIRGMKYDEN